MENGELQHVDLLLTSWMSFYHSTLYTLHFPFLRPDDWDDDGIPNEEDLDPLAFDGDNLSVVWPDSSFQQIYSIDNAGLVTIDKHDHVATRNTNDVVTVDYVIEHDGSHQ